LVENAGVTGSVTGMWEAYAQRVGKSTESLTEAEKRQAEYNGILEATAFQVGDAARYAEQFAGRQAALEAATLRVNQALGASVQSALTPLLAAITPIVNAVADWIEKHPAFTAGIAAAATAGTALAVAIFGIVPAVTALTAAFSALQASLGVIGAISIVIGILTGLAVWSANAKTPVEELNEEFAQLKSELQSIGASVSSAESAFAVLTSGTATAQEVADAKKALAQAIPEAVIGYDSEGNAVLATNDILREHIELLKQERAEKLRNAQEAAKDLAETSKLDEEAAQIKIERLKEERRQTEELYAEMLASGNYNDGDRALLESYRDDDALAQNTRDLAEAELELKNARDQTSLRLQEQYAIENELMGERDAATQLAMQHVMEQAAQQRLSLDEYRELLTETLSDEQQMAGFREEAAKAAQEQAAATTGIKNAQDALNTAQSAAKQKQQTQMLKAYVKEIKNGTKGTKTYEKAVEELKKEYGDLYPNIEDNIGAIGAIVNSEDEAAQAAVNAARTAIQNLMEVQRAILAVEGASSDAAIQAKNLLDVLAAIDQGLAGLEIGGLPDIDFGSGGGGGGGNEKSRWEMELDELEHYAALGEDVTQRQIDAIQRILETEKLSTEERWQLEEELYDKTNQLIQDRIDLYKSLTDLTQEEASQQAAAIQYMLNAYALSTEERAALTERLNETKKAMDGDYLRDYIAHLERMLREEQLNATQRKSVLEEIMQARIQLLQKEREAAQEQIDQQIAAVEEARDARIAAIDKEIAALDDLLAARKRAQQEEDDQDTLRRLQESLLYEKDDYNRQQLEKRIEQKQQEIADREFEQGIQDQKDALKEKQEAIRQSAEAEIASLQRMAEQKQLFYEEQLERQQEYGDLSLEMQNAYGEMSLEAQGALYGAQYEAGDAQNAAMVELTNAGQQADVATLLSYEGDWSAAGTTLGSALKAALQAKFDEIEAAASAMARNVASIVASAMSQLEGLNAAASAASKAVTVGGNMVKEGASARSSRSINVTQNFNVPAASPSAVRAASKQMARELAK
jgi:hypothetical protein